MSLGHLILQKRKALVFRGKSSNSGREHRSKSIGKQANTNQSAQNSVGGNEGTGVGGGSDSGGDGDGDGDENNIGLPLDQILQILHVLVILLTILISQNGKKTFLTSLWKETPTFLFGVLSGILIKFVVPFLVSLVGG